MEKQRESEINRETEMTAMTSNNQRETETEMEINKEIETEMTATTDTEMTALSNPTQLYKQKTEINGDTD